MQEEARPIRQNCEAMVIAVNISLAIVVLLHIRFLGSAFTDNLLFFWIPLLAMGFIAAILAFLREDSFPLVSIFILSLTLHLVGVVAQPDNMTWAYDALFHLQLLRHLSQTGHWDIGFAGPPSSYAFSFYALTDISWSVVQSVTSLPILQLVTFYPAILNNLVLLFVYILASRTLGLRNKVGNFAVLVFALNPFFQAKFGYISEEGYAVILFSLVLPYSLSLGSRIRSEINKRHMLSILILAMLAITLAHHLTAYMLAIALAVSMLLTYAITRRIVVPVRIALLSVVLPAVWLVFAAVYFLQGHLFQLVRVLQESELLFKQVGYHPQFYSGYYASPYLADLTIVRNIALVGLTTVGLLFLLARLGVKFRHPSSILRVAERNPIPTYMVVSLFLFSAAAFFTLFGSRAFGNDVGADSRYRPLNFAFYFIAPFAGLGVLDSLRWLERLSVALFRRFTSRNWRILGLTFMILFVIVFLPSCMIQAQPRYMYESGSHASLYDEYSVDPQQQVVHALWVRHFVAANSIFAGSESSMRYVTGYGDQKEWRFGVNSTSLPGWQNLYYVIDKNNLRLPGAGGEKLSLSDVEFLNGNLLKIYDDGSLSDYSRPT